jgi:hypothetical protein
MGRTTKDLMEQLIVTRTLQARDRVEALPKVSSNFIVKAFEQGMRQMLDDLVKMNLIQFMDVEKETNH